MIKRSNIVIDDIIEGLADDWGPKDDPHRDDFIIGARHVAYGESAQLPSTTIESAAALHSGIIAAREEGLP